MYTKEITQEENTMALRKLLLTFAAVGCLFPVASIAEIVEQSSSDVMQSSKILTGEMAKMDKNIKETSDKIRNAA